MIEKPEHLPCFIFAKQKRLKERSLDVRPESDPLDRLMLLLCKMPSQ